MPRIIHVSDLHIGARLGRHSQNDDIRKCLEFIAGAAASEKVHAVVVAGDVFDSCNPSSDSEDAYYDFLARLEGAGAAAVIIPGNHDSPERLNAPAGLLKRHGVHIPGYGGGTVELTLGGEGVSFAALPYLPESVRAACGGAAEAECYSGALCAALAALVDSAVSPNVVAVCHLFVKNGVASGSERNMSLGGSFLVDFAALPQKPAYFAFGHLHRCQRVAENAFYSGSIVPISIDEAAAEKKMVFADVSGGRLVRAEEVTLPRFSGYAKIEGDFVEVMEAVGSLSNAYVSIVFKEILSLARQDELYKTARARAVRIVSCSFDIASAAGEETQSAEFCRMSLEELFKKFAEERGASGESILARFASVLSRLREGGR